MWPDLLHSLQIAGVIFKFLSDEEIHRLEKNQANIRFLTTKLKRGKRFSEWNYGEMHAVGFRQPCGGRPGDGYGPYPASEVLSLDDIRTLFAYATVRRPSMVASRSLTISPTGH